MEIEDTTFGTITIDGKTYEHDVIIRLSGEVLKRKKKLSKKYYGTSHVLSKDEAKFIFEKGCEQLILGSGQMGNVHLSRKLRRISRKRAARYCCSPPQRRSVRSTVRRRRRSGCFTLPAESGSQDCGSLLGFIWHFIQPFGLDEAPEKALKSHTISRQPVDYRSQRFVPAVCTIFQSRRFCSPWWIEELVVDRGAIAESW